MKSFEVSGKVALVTGSNRGIGKSIVESLLSHGASKVYACMRDLKNADCFSDKRVCPVKLDIINDQQVLEASKLAADVELVINNAGILKNSSPFSSDTFENFNAEFDVNVLGLLRVVRAFSPVLKKNGGGAFVQLNSVASLKSFSDFATYSATKAASYSLTQAIREKLTEQGTLVVSVHPGPIETDMATSAGFAGEPPEIVSEKLVAALKAGHFHLFPDSMASEIGAAYQSFASSVIGD